METMFLTSRTQNVIIACVMSVFDNVEAFLFDLDGTLLDSDDEAVAKIARHLERLGVRHAQRRARWLVMAAETPANTLLTGLDLLGLDETLMGLADRLNHLQAHRTPDSFLMVPGIDLALHSLHGHYRLGVVTTRSRRDAERFLAQFELSGLGWQESERFVDNLRKVTAADVQRVANTYLKDMQFAVLGNPAIINRAAFAVVED